MAQGLFAGGNGTQENPFLIEDADDLNAMRMHLNSYFELINDINLSNGKYNLNQGWQPINNFAGIVDGKNHKIINLYINRPTENYVGFFRGLHGQIKNISFVDVNVVGHDYVGVVSGFFTNYRNGDLTLNAGMFNISVVNGKITGNKNVSAVFGGMFGLNAYTYSHIFVDAEIQSEEGIAYGVCIITNLGRVSFGNGYSHKMLESIIYDCDCNCNCDCLRNCDCSYMQNSNFHNCISKLRKNESIATYYSFSNDVSVVFQNCYADNSETQPVIYAGITYKNITDIQHEIDLLPSADSNYFVKKVNAMLEPKYLNNDAIYLQFNNGYYVYDFANNEFVQRYAKFSNENAKEIIQNGMDKVSFSKIPNSKLKEIQDKYGKVKVINCINAHKRIVYKINNLKMNYDKQKSVYRKKVEFNKFNEVTSIKKK